MSTFDHVIPRSPVPALRVSLAGGGTFDLVAETPERFTLVVFYRGLHCPICRAQLAELERRTPELRARGVRVAAVSMDDAERAQRAKDEWRLPTLRIGYGLDAATARAWGLYLSSGNGVTSAGVEEPAFFSEPGLFLIARDATLHFSSVQTMPFARPRFDDLLDALDYISEHDYPARGNVHELPAVVR